MIDHIIDRLEISDLYAANADRLRKMSGISRCLHTTINMCSLVAQRERRAAKRLADRFGIGSNVIAQERAVWQRLHRLLASDSDFLTVSDILWIRATARYSRVGSRNWRYARELMERLPVAIGTPGEVARRPSEPQ